MGLRVHQKITYMYGCGSMWEAVYPIKGPLPCTIARSIPQPVLGLFTRGNVTIIRNCVVREDISIGKRVVLSQKPWLKKENIIVGQNYNIGQWSRRWRRIESEIERS